MNDIYTFFLTNYKNWDVKETKAFVVQHKLHSKFTGDLFDYKVAINLELSHNNILEENKKLKLQLNENETHMAFLEEEKALLSRKLQRFEENESSYMIMEEKIFILEEKNAALNAEIEHIQTLYKGEVRMNDRLQKNITVLQNRIVELHEIIKKKLYPNISEDTWEDKEKLVEKLLQTSKMLGVTNTELAFMHNQIERDSLRISELIGLLNAAKTKEDRLILRHQEKIEQLKKKHNENRTYYHSVMVKDRNTIDELDKIIASSNTEIVFLKNKIDLLLTRYPYDYPTPSIEDSEKYQIMYEELVKNISENVEEDIKGKDFTTIIYTLNKQFLTYLKIKRMLLLSEKERNRLLLQAQYDKTTYGNTIEKIGKMKEESNVLYLKKITAYQAEIRAVQEAYEKSKIQYENVRIDLQRAKLK